VLGLVLCLVELVASDASNSTTDGARDTISDAGSEVWKLALGLLLLALLVLLGSLLLQGLVADEVAEGLLAGTESLVPRAGAAVGVVLGDTRGWDAVAADVGSGVRGVVLDFGFGLLVLASGLSCVRVVLTVVERSQAYLVGVATDERAQSGLSGARGRVDVRLESGSVLVRHVVDVVVKCGG
jgi:hypothetical protein